MALKFFLIKNEIPNFMRCVCTLYVYQGELQRYLKEIDLFDELDTV